MWLDENGKRYNQRYLIEVKPDGHYIERVLTTESIGNFNPIFCVYKGKKCLVNSTFGDISDPFRRTREYFTSLYIETVKEEVR